MRCSSLRCTQAVVSVLRASRGQGLNSIEKQAVTVCCRCVLSVEPRQTNVSGQRSAGRPPRQKRLLGLRKSRCLGAWIDVQIKVVSTHKGPSCCQGSFQGGFQGQLFTSILDVWFLLVPVASLVTVVWSPRISDKSPPQSHQSHITWR